MHDAAVKIEGTAIEIILTLSFFLVQQVGTRLPVPYIPHDCARKAALTSQHPCYLGEIFVASLLDDIRVPMMSSLLRPGYIKYARFAKE